MIGDSMKIFISADMEGISTTTFWKEVDFQNESYAFHHKQLTNEVLAATLGALKAGATEIIIRDAHEFSNNIDLSKFPKEVTFIRGWSGHPYSMISGLDSSFDAVIFIGYHSGAFSSGNPLAHTENPELLYVKINGQYVDEFTIYAWAATLEHVPVIFVSGDEDLCKNAKKISQNIFTCSTKKGDGASTLNEHPKVIESKIKEGVFHALTKNLTRYTLSLPKQFHLEVCYKNHTKANRYSYFPGVQRKDSHTLTFDTKDYYELLRVFQFISS